MSTYKLYATKTGEIPDGVEFSLRPYGANYLLVFTDKELDKPFIEIPTGTPLTSQERQFITRCKLIVNKRYVDEHKDEYTEILDSFFAELEKQLQEESDNGEKSLKKKN